ncbi:uncharacterized protein LOC6497671 isoform X2 [Drosophila ananassae]|uniref:uncharacterized protein LOC6497671 isoform X2 n=1 Tax=Drosophila ananassae TaxID=7217 RepID=UPI001CFFA36F|nr:uncharacterized protein LOC6497671 isoform X2 [Drosophila ananassae]
MTELRRTNGLHKQHSLRDRQGHPLLHALADHGCNLSSGGNSAASTTSSSTATATTALGGGGNPGGSAGGNGNGNGNGIMAQRSIEFDEHDIFYVSPSKRKGVAPGVSGNVVTFSNYVSEQRLTPSSSNRGSLKRSKGRSNQSLCSCDAGDEAQLELQPNATRPLYEYSLERRRKTHTYSCEQNAQILMRLERERNRKLSLTGVESGGLGLGSAAAGGAAVAGGDPQSDTPSLSDVDVIPPVPPPPAMKRNGSMRSLRLLQHLHQHSSGSSSSNNNNLSQLCSSDLLQECTKSALDDCTATLLKCTTTSNHSSSSNSNMGPACNGNGNAIGSNNNNHIQAKPDLCQPPGHAHNHRHKLLPGSATPTHHSHPPPPPFAAHEDEIFSPHSKKSDPSLCFVGGVGAGPGLGGAGGAGGGSGGNVSSKYNTIGPSSDYARHLAHYSRYLQKQHHQQQMAHFQQQRCRCFSQSLLNFPQQQQPPSQPQAAPQHQQQQPLGQPAAIFHTSSMDWTLPINSRSFGNLVNIDGGCRVPYQKMPHHQTASGNPVSGGAGSNGGLGLAASSTFTLTSFDSDIVHGLKERESQTSLHHPHSHPHPHSHSHPHTHPHHYHGGGGDGSGSVTPQKHHQLHSSVTSIMPWKHRQCPSRGSSSSGTNSFRFDAAKHWLAVSSILLIIGAASVAVPLALRVAASAPFEERLRVAVQLLDQVPLIDGHNDLPWNIRKFLHNKLNDFNFDEDLRNVMPWGRSHWSHTDLTRLKKGRISAQFWAAYVPCEAQHRDAVQLTLEQIDVIKRLTDRYSPQLTTCTSAQDIIEAHKNQQLCSLTGVEGGHSLGGSLAVLRTLYAIGVRYMTLTSTCHTPWADSSYADAPTFNMKHGGLTIFGKTIIREMNRLGMMVDLSHVSKGTMRDALEVSEAPVIFSHSSAYELCNTSRNVQDDILQALAKNGGLVMVNFYSKFLSCSDNSTVHDAVAHINHIKRVAGIDHVGLGAGYDGINYTPKGLEDVSSYPTLFAELLGGGWTIDELTKLAGGNFLRVMQQVEKLRDDKKASGVKPYEDHPNFRTDDPYNCTSS